ncbi:hypothetical protein RB548_22055 (plasmid) [Sinorhizobium chiapasense]|uniref:Uncharacterized protein n=1 Tax=Sinorhizobium chiapasense TaxID=501572 RepID=A0ABZ2BL82_9HYPH
MSSQNPLPLACRIRASSIFVVELVDLAAGFADLEGGDARMDLAVSRMTADDEGIHAFETMHSTRFQQLVERSVDLEWRPQAVAAHTIQNAVCAERLHGRLQHREHEALVLRQFQIVGMDRLRHDHLRWSFSLESSGTATAVPDHDIIRSVGCAGTADRDDRERLAFNRNRARFF